MGHKGPPMLLTITNTTPPAADLARRLHREPGRSHAVEVPTGRAHLFFPEATAERCTAAVLLDIDPLAEAAGPPPLARAYTASALLGLAVVRLFDAALAAAH